MSPNLRPWAGLVVGMLLGASLLQAHTWRVRNALLDQVRLSHLDAQRWREESMRLRDQLALINRRNERATYVQTVTLEVIKSPVPLIDVETALQPYTESLLGMPLASVKLTLIYHLINRRRMVLGNRVYRAEVKSLLVSPDVVILLNLVPSGRPHSS